MEKLKVGLIGAGGIASVHANILSRDERVELVGVADVHAPAAEAFASRYGLRHQASDYSALIPHIDAAIVAIPTHLHSQAAASLLRAGKAVFCEKPLARTREQAQEILDAQSASGAPLQVGFVRRFDAEWQAWAEVVRGGRIGSPVVWRDVQAHAGPNSAWYYEDEQGGGPFLDGCVHNYDWALQLFGPAQWAFCHARSFRGSSAFDTGTATVRFQSGDELLISWSWGLPPRTSGGSVFEVLGPYGALTFQREGEGAPYFQIKQDDVVRREPIDPDALSKAYEAQMDEFVRVARGETAPTAGGADGVAALELALAVLESARIQQVVAVGS
jgi:predicted dehydrogenase